MIKVILITLLVFLLVRMIIQGAFSFFTGMYGGNSKNPERKKEGEVSIESKPKLEKKINKDDGQYVDYEEIK